MALNYNRQAAMVLNTCFYSINQSLFGRYFALILFNQSIAINHQFSQHIELTGGGPLPQAPVVGF